MKRYFLITLALVPIFLCDGNLTTESIDFQPIESYAIQKKSHPALDELPSFEELFQHANDLFSKEKYKEAAQLYKKALSLHPTCAHSFFNLGQAYYWQKKYPKALDAYKKTLRHQPDHFRAYTQIGKLMIDVNQCSDALIPLEKAIELNPTSAEPRLLLCQAYCDQQMFTKALTMLQKGLDINPNEINLNFSLANVYNHLNQLENALALYKKLDKIVPNNSSIIYNIGFTLKKLGRTEESLNYYNRAIEIDPNHYDALFSRGLAYLVLGDFEKGWEGYEWRYQKPQQGSLRSFTQPRWNGQDEAKTILLHAEQGFGDTLQFIRYAQFIKKTKNVTIIAAVQKPLVSLLRLCPYIDQVIAIGEESPAFDAHAPLMSLPHILKTTVDTIPCDIPYLFADEKLVQEWKEVLDQNPNYKIGICVQGNENYATPHLRTTVALKSVQAKQLAPICSVPGVSIYSLQKTTGTDQFKNLPENVKIITFDGDFDQSHGRFMDTVAVIKNLDLIITVDTSLGHLAAALGKTTWIMLPNPADWRWMQNRTDTPWYPNIRLFKQPTPGDWDSMIAEVAQELTKLVEGKTAVNSPENIQA